MLLRTIQSGLFVRVVAVASALAAPSAAFAQFMPVVGGGTGSTNTGFNPFPFERITVSANAHDGGAMQIAPGQTVLFGMTTVVNDDSILYGARFDYRLDVFENGVFLRSASRTVTTGGAQKLYNVTNVFASALAPAVGNHLYDTRVRVTVDGVTRTDWGFYTVKVVQ